MYVDLRSTDKTVQSVFTGINYIDVFDCSSSQTIYCKIQCLQHSTMSTENVYSVQVKFTDRLISTS